MSKTSYMPDVKTLQHRRGEWWYEVPAPRKFLHRHLWETRAFVPDAEGGFWTERCACGATHYSDIDGWQEELKPRFR